MNISFKIKNPQIAGIPYTELPKTVCKLIGKYTPLSFDVRFNTVSETKPTKMFKIMALNGFLLLKQQTNTVSKETAKTDITAYFKYIILSPLKTYSF